jgi:DNA-binding transcriptional regulator YiaG
MKNAGPHLSGLRSAEAVGTGHPAGGSPSWSAVAAARSAAPWRGWTGREASALRRALLMGKAEFAAAVGVRPSSVSYWEQNPDSGPSRRAQAGLYELLGRADVVERAMFRKLTGRLPAAAPAPGGDADGGARVVPLVRREPYIPDFWAVACGEVTAARSALGLSPEEFAGWLGTTVGRVPDAGEVVAWEACDAVPPGDVVMAARFFLAGAR